MIGDLLHGEFNRRSRVVFALSLTVLMLILWAPSLVGQEQSGWLQALRFHPLPVAEQTVTLRLSTLPIDPPMDSVQVLLFPFESTTGVVSINQATGISPNFDTTIRFPSAGLWLLHLTPKTNGILLEDQAIQVPTYATEAHLENVWGNLAIYDALRNWPSPFTGISPVRNVYWRIFDQRVDGRRVNTVYANEEAQITLTIRGGTEWRQIEASALGLMPPTYLDVNLFFEETHSAALMVRADAAKMWHYRMTVQFPNAGSWRMVPVPVVFGESSAWPSNPIVIEVAPARQAATSSEDTETGFLLGVIPMWVWVLVWAGLGVLLTLLLFIWFRRRDGQNV